MAFTELSLRLSIVFITLLILTRLMGRKEISQLTLISYHPFQSEPLELHLRLTIH